MRKRSLKRTLEWSLPSPVPVYNFARTPIIKARDQHWEDKYGSEELKMDEPDDGHGVHMPDRSWWPLWCGLGILILGFGLITRKMVFHLLVVQRGSLILKYSRSEFSSPSSIVFWAIEGPEVTTCILKKTKQILN